jgi:hypothetical protein
MKKINDVLLMPQIGLYQISRDGIFDRQQLALLLPHTHANASNWPLSNASDVPHQQ